MAVCISEISTVNPARAFGDHLFEYIDLSAVNQDAKRITGSRRIPGRDAPSRARQVLAEPAMFSFVGAPHPQCAGPRRRRAIRGHRFDWIVCCDPASISTLRYLFQWVRSPQFRSAFMARAGDSVPAIQQYRDRIVRNRRFRFHSSSEQRQIARCWTRRCALCQASTGSCMDLDLLKVLVSPTCLAIRTRSHLRRSIVASKDVRLFINAARTQFAQMDDSGVLCWISDCKTRPLRWSEQRFVSGRQVPRAVSKRIG